MNLKVVAIIPARYASTRLPGKPILDIGGKPMVVRVAERARQVAAINRIIIATDDQRIFDAVMATGEEAMMTSPDHPTGTDRLAEVAAKLDADIIVNVQGDEPLIEPATIEAALTPLLADNSIVMSTTSEPIESAADLLNPNVVKVVTDPTGFALYFSRSPIPFPRVAVQAHGSIEAAIAAEPALLNRYAKHTGMYVYRREFLLTYAKLPSTPLEQSELLEQLRALEHGYRIKVVNVAHRSIGVDTPEDLERVRQIVRQDLQD
ncbi:MAG: 3-deoxy-manno-octulosonate cytidylyltransferase [Acidobacteria bacterium]|nr:3-deoxy-manno-octulosonate cytidylyltransferase [Acidobacteriota bacterium]